MAYREEIVDIDLDNNGTIHRTFLNHAIGKGDSLENRYGVRLFRNGEPLNLGGASCEGFFMAPDGNNILISGQNTRTSGNVAYVQLPQACYNTEGQFTLAIKVIDGGVTGTMRIIDGVVDNTGTDGAVAPVGTVPSYQEVLAVYNQMLEAKAGSIRYDIIQDLTSAQREQARDNIGMINIDFSLIEGDDYLMTVSKKSEFVQISGDDYMLVTMAD